MSLTNIEQCMGAGNGISSRKDYRNIQRGDRNGVCGNSRFNNSLSARETKNNRIPNFQLQKTDLNLSSSQRFSKKDRFFVNTHYNYISDNISTNIEPTQEAFLSDLLIKR